MRPFTFTVTVTVERESGPFASREDVAQELRDALEGADPGSVDLDETSYSVTEWEVAGD